MNHCRFLTETLGNLSMRYFIAGHVWIFIAGTLYVGMTSTVHRDYSMVFGHGPALYNPIYFVCCLGIAAFGFAHLARAWQLDGFKQFWRKDKHE